jgi:hypothetical protein
MRREIIRQRAQKIAEKFKKRALEKRKGAAPVLGG